MGSTMFKKVHLAKPTLVCVMKITW